MELNGHKNNYLLNGGVALAIGLVLSSIIFRLVLQQLEKRRRGDYGYRLGKKAH